jgi:GDP-4-dehydro-6-deoxy-D-mannose reductase
MKKILITGASGFVGSHLIDHLLDNDDSLIYGTYRSESPKAKSDRLTFLKVDFQNKSEVDAALEQVQPDWIFHLAAQSNVPQSIKDPISTFHANIDSQLNLFLSLKEKELLQTKILVVTSAEVYGFIRPEDLPVDENTPHRPANPYAVSKIAQDYLGFQYQLSYKLPIIRVRPFNHVGPGQSPIFVVSDFAKQIVEIEKQQREPIMWVGNLEAKRDFTDVRDMVRLYPSLMEKGIVGDVYNAGSGRSRSAKEILDGLLSLSDAKITVKQDPAKMRPSDVPDIVANIKKVNDHTGWKPEIPFEKTLKDTLDYWRNLV